MDLVYFLGEMKVAMKANLKMAKSKERAFTAGTMGDGLRGIGLII